MGAYWAKIQREVVVAYGADTDAGFLRQPYVAADGPNPTDLLFWDDFDTKVMSVYGQISLIFQTRLSSRSLAAMTEKAIGE